MKGVEAERLGRSGIYLPLLSSTSEGWEGGWARCLTFVPLTRLDLAFACDGWGGWFLAVIASIARLTTGFKVCMLAT